MPRQKGIKRISFQGGLLTEASNIDYPDGYFDDCDNVVITKDIKVTRRLALNAETAYQYISDGISKTDFESFDISEYIWTGVGGDASLEFYVLKLGNYLYFFDNKKSPRSSFKKTFSVDLNSYKTSNYTGTQNIPVSMTNDIDKLFVAGKAIYPIYIEYNNGAISVNRITIKIRDFDDLDDGVEVDEEPTVYNLKHEYNMRNRGWVKPASSGVDPYQKYFTDKSKYPSKNKSWWTGKNSSATFDTGLLDKYFAGTTSAPKGHYILEAFNKKRSLVSGIVGIADETEEDMPSQVYYAFGRIFWAHKNTLYFNRVIKAKSDIGQCYQKLDPTAEELSDLLADDGGVITINNISEIRALKSMGKYLLIYSDKGIWALSGEAGIFKATNYSLDSVSEINITSTRSLVAIEDVHFLWSEDGIYSVTIEKVSQVPVATNITFNKIDSFYNDITENEKESCIGVYDKYNKLLRWIYADGDNYNKGLVFDLKLRAFLPYSFPTAPLYAKVKGMSTLGTRTGFTTTSNVVVGNDNVAISGDNVVVLTDEDELDTFVGTKYLVFVEDGSNVKYTFCELNDRSFYDFKFLDNTGVSFNSYFSLGHEQLGNIDLIKQTPMISCYFERTEQNFVLNSDGVTYSFDYPSGLFLTGYWDWSDDNGRKTSRIQCYRFQRNFIVDPASLTFRQGHDIISTKNKLRGKGHTLKLRFDSEEGKDFRLQAISLIVDSNARP